jgi:hypothetical protein
MKVFLIKILTIRKDLMGKRFKVGCLSIATFISKNKRRNQLRKEGIKEE